MQRKRRIQVLVATLSLVAVLGASCGGAATPAAQVPPTKTPRPTFTAAPNTQPTPIPFPTTSQSQSGGQPPAGTQAAQAPAATQAPTKAPATAAPQQPTQAPTPSKPRFSAAQTANVRSGPGTAYQILGQLSYGDTYDITGTNSDNQWWQFTYNGQPAWVSRTLCNPAGDLDSVQVAQNIPPVPTQAPRPTAAPQPTSPPPPPAAPTNPPPPPAPTTPYVWDSGFMKTAPNCGAVYMKGYIVDAALNPINGVTVELEFFGNKVYRVSGVNEPAGGFGFTPLNQNMYKTAVPFHMRLVQSQSDLTPLSDTVTINFSDCGVTGQYTDIVFKKR